MTQDPIIEQLHQVREQLAQEFDFDVYAIVADAQAQQERNQHPVVSFAQRTKVATPPDLAIPEKLPRAA
jgi:hypothetical protein